MILIQLFWEFFKTGLFAVGGGLATIPFLTNIGQRTGWFTSAQLADMIAVSESTPGPLGVNMATYVGYTSAGILGSVVATLGLITPSIIVILIVAAVLQKFRNNPTVEALFYGLRPASTGLIAAAGWGVVCIALMTLDWKLEGASLLLNLDVKWQCVIVAAVVYFFTHFKKTKGMHPVAWIALSAVIGIVFNL